MTVDEETTEYNLRLNAAQMLTSLAEVNSKAGSIPEVLKNIENSLDAFSKKFGISFGAAEKEMQSTIKQAEQLRKILENPIAAPLVINNADALKIAQAQDPFASIGMSQTAGIKALNDQRKEGILLAQQQAKSEAMIADEINVSVEAEQKVLSSQEKQKILAADIARINAEDAAKKEAILSAAAANPLPESEGLTEEYLASGDALQAYNQAILQNIDLSEIAANTTGQLTKAQLDAAIAEKEVGAEAEKSSKLVVGGVDIMRRAVSFLVGQLLFQLLAAFQNVFASAIDGLKKLETSFYDLANAEKAMSENGINVTFTDLEAVIDRLHTKFQGLFSKTELQETVSQIALVTKNLGLTTDQIEKIAATAATIQLSHPDKSLTEIATTLTTSDLNGRLTSLAKLGVNIDDIKAKEAELAAQLGISTKELTEQQKATIELEAAYESVTNGSDALANRQNTVTGSLQQLSAVWQDFLASAAQDFAPLIITFLQSLIKLLLQAQQALTDNKRGIDSIVAGLTVATKVVFFFVDAWYKLTVAISKALYGINGFIAKIPFIGALVDKISHLDTTSTTPADTPTGIPSSASTVDNSKLVEAEQKTEDELNKIFQENRDKRVDIDENYAEKLQDIALNNQQKLEDIATKEAQATADAYTNYNQKIQDIETSTAQKIQDTKQETNQKEKELTAKHYDDLKKLRDKYLMDLEDALHNRDARQILRLIQQYQNDKQASDDSYKQEQQKIQQDEKLKLAQIEQDRKIAEAAAKRDLQRKLADIALAAARERQAQAINYQRQLNDAQIAYNRQIQAQQVYLQRKLRDLATAIQQEYNLTAAGMAAINALIGSYAGTAAAGMLGSTTGTTSNPAATNVSTSSIGSPIGNASSPSSINGGLYVPPGGGLAEGGSFLATTPTKINVAENRPEVITATPLGRPGADVGKLFAQGGSGGMSGQIEVAMSLSPDLEARIVRNTLNETANVVLKINRSKV